MVRRRGASLLSSSPLLATKLGAPPVDAARRVPRPRLLDRIEEASTTLLLLIQAPAGFGKTSVLSEWGSARASRGAPVAWLALDEQDSEPTRFFAYVIAALEAARPGATGHAAGLLGAPGSASTEALLAALVDALGKEPRDTTLVLDDYHAVTDERIHEALATLLAHPPKGLHLVLATRSTPPLPLARLRARGLLRELGARDLAFDASEVTQLATLAGQALGAEEAAALADRTEGWAAGLQLAALSLGHRKAGGALSLRGSQREVFDYLASEVFEAQPPELRAFLLETSVLEQASAPLCTALTGVEGARAVLETLERGGLFVTALDAERRWYRYHQLFREFLLARLERERSEDAIAALHRRAAVWYVGSELPAPALAHAVRARDYPSAARILASAGAAMSLAGEAGFVRRQLEALPESALRAEPQLGISHAWACMTTPGQGRLAEARLRQVEAAIQGSDSDAANVLEGQIAAVRATMAHYAGRWSACIEQAERALALLPSDDAMRRGLVLGNLARGHLRRGEAGAAVRTLAKLERLAERAVVPAFVQIMSVTTFGRARFMQGRLADAERQWRAARSLASPDGSGPVPIASQAEAGLALVAYERDRLEDARALARTALGSARRWIDPVTLVEALLTSARIARACGDEQEADRAIEEAREAAQAAALGWLVARVEATAALFAVERGDLRAASAWADDCAPDLVDPQGNLRDVELLALARIRAEQGEHGAAREIAAEVRRAAEAEGLGSVALHASVLEAIAMDAGGDRAEAIAKLETVLRTAASQGFVRLVVDQGEAALRLFTALFKERGSARRTPARIPDAYLRRLRLAFDRVPGRKQGAGPVGAEPLADPLSAREIEILGLLAEGASNAQIAKRLFVALSTVKRHVHNAFAKLGVQSRTQAVARARQLGVLR